MHNPLLWLGLSLFLVAVCLVAVLLVAIPVFQELARTARSAEKLLDMLSRELPPTLQSLRSTGDDLSELSGQVNEGVRSASQVVTQVDQGLESVRTQAESVKRNSVSLLAGFRAAWQQWRDPDAELYYEDPTLYDDFDAYGEQSLETEEARQDVTSQVNHQSPVSPDLSLDTTPSPSATQTANPTVNSPQSDSSTASVD